MAQSVTTINFPGLSPSRCRHSVWRWHHGDHAMYRIEILKPLDSQSVHFSSTSVRSSGVWSSRSHSSPDSLRPFHTAPRSIDALSLHPEEGAEHAEHAGGDGSGGHDGRTRDVTWGVDHHSPATYPLRTLHAKSLPLPCSSAAKQHLLCPAMADRPDDISLYCARHSPPTVDSRHNNNRSLAPRDGSEDEAKNSI